MSNFVCSIDSCPVILNSTCVIYQGESLIYTGITDGDNLQAALQKIDGAFSDAGLGYAFQNGVIQTTPGVPVELGGSLLRDTTIGGNYKLTLAGRIQSTAFITTGGTSSQFVKGNGTLDSNAYQLAGNYITALTGDGTAVGPGSAALTLATVNANPGTYGSATLIPRVTVDAKGRVTAITTTAIPIPSGILVFEGDVTGSGTTGAPVTLTLATVNPNVYNSLTFLNLKVNAKGLVTGASPVTNLNIEGALGYVPVPNTRTITINGVTQSLQADRSWTIAGAVASVTASAPLSSTGGANPNISIAQADGSTNGYLSSTDWTTFNNKVPTSRILTINGVSFDLATDRTWSINSMVYPSAGIAVSTGAAWGTSLVDNSTNWNTAYSQRISSASAPLSIVSNTISISQANGSTNGYLSSTDWTTFNGKQASGNYITALTGEATATGPGSATVTLSTPAVTGKLLTGVNITGGTVVATDTILEGFGKLQNQINALVGGTIYQGVWNAATNTPTLTSSVGTDGHYYITNVYGTTNLNGISEWHVGDWAIFHDGVWQKVDNTDAVISVNSYTGAVSLVSSDIPEGATNLYYTNTRARQAISLTTTGSSGVATYNNTTGVLNVPNYNPDLTGYVPTTRTLTINGVAQNLSTDETWSVGTVTSVAALTIGTTGTDITSSVATSTTTPVITLNIPTASAANRGALSANDWIAFNGKQGALNGTGFVKVSGTTITYDNSTYALDSDVVKLTGNQSIAGFKTFTGYGLFDNGIYIKKDGTLSGIIGYNTIDANDTSVIFSLTNALSAAEFKLSNLTQLRFFDLPNASGTIALTSDIPSLSGYVTIGTDQTITGTKTFSSQIITDIQVVSPAFKVQNSGNTSLYTLLLTSSNGVRNVYLPDADGTIALTSNIPSLTNYVTLNTAQTITGDKTFSGAVINDGDLYIKQDASFANKTGYVSLFAGVGNLLSYNFGNSNTNQSLSFPTNSRVYSFPDATGTIALTSDLHNAVTIGTANGLSLSTQVLSLGLASTSATGALSSTDWNTFNGKQNALTNPVTGTGTSSYLPKFTGTTTLGNSILYDTGSALLIGATSASNGQSKLELVGAGPVGLKIISSAVNGNNTFLSIQSSKEWRFLTNRGDISGNQGDLIIRNDTDLINHIILNQGGSTTFYGAVTGTSFNLGNGQFLRLTRNTGALQYDAFGIVAGTDNTRLISTGDFDVVNGSLASQFKIASTGAATFSANTVGTTALIGNSSDNAMAMTLYGGSVAGNSNNVQLRFQGRKAAVDQWAIGNAVATGDNTRNFDIYDLVAGANRFRITDGGNVGIGTSNPLRRFVVEAAPGTFQEVGSFTNLANNASGDFAIVTRLGANAANTNSYHYIAVTGGADRFYVYGNGNVVNTNGSYGTLSDSRLKENISDATPKLADLLAVKIKNFNLIGEETKQIGVIAQELEKIFPSMVETDGKTGMKQVKTSVFIPMLIKAVQELKAELDTLKNK